MGEADGAAAARGQHKPRYGKLNFFATHPTDLERADTLSLLSKRVRGGEFDGAKQYAQALKPWMHLFLDDHLKINDFGGTEYILARIGGEEWSPDCCSRAANSIDFGAIRATWSVRLISIARRWWATRACSRRGTGETFHANPSLCCRPALLRGRARNQLVQANAPCQRRQFGPAGYARA
jgi:hypothetical protein